MEESREKHLKLVDQVSKTFAKNGIEIKLHECEWAREEVKFLVTWSDKKEWGKRCNILQQLKISKNTEFGDEAELLELYADASGYGAGACLAEKQGEGTGVIQYASIFNYRKRNGSYQMGC